MVVIKVLDDEALFVIHDEQDLLYGWVTIETLKLLVINTKTTYKNHVPDQQDTFFIVRVAQGEPLAATK